MRDIPPSATWERLQREDRVSPVVRLGIYGILAAAAILFASALLVAFSGSAITDQSLIQDQKYAANESDNGPVVAFQSRKTRVVISAVLSNPTNCSKPVIQTTEYGADERALYIKLGQKYQNDAPSTCSSDTQKGVYRATIDFNDNEMPETVRVEIRGSITTFRMERDDDVR
ncbi:hypothetical protein [Halococcus sp. AFM35]|uniref:hypothetical protein n=1 Tax=Halococcus sp. AFM35 TaxID=3421653 RepID=UPI003EBC37A9